MIEYIQLRFLRAITYKLRIRRGTIYLDFVFNKLNLDNLERRRKLGGLIFLFELLNGTKYSQELLSCVPFTAISSQLW